MAIKNIFIFALCFGYVLCKDIIVPAWSYEDESNWPGVACKTGGHQQSPIDIRTRNVQLDYDHEFIGRDPITYVGYNEVLVTGINNGHTIQFSSEGDESIHPFIYGGPLKHRYRLEQLHFHWLSEHALDGYKFPMELHFVHVRSDLMVGEALNETDGLAIVAVFGLVQVPEPDEEYKALSEVLDYTPKLQSIGNRQSGIILDMRKLFSPNMDSYISYAGSLTSPECNEAVIWIIYDTPLFLSDTQYHQFSKTAVGRHNYRSLQKVVGQKLWRPAPERFITPNVVTMARDFFSSVAYFFRNVTLLFQML